MPRRPPLVRLWLWRARVPLTVLAAVVSAVVVVEALQPAPEPRSTVLVAARALEAGTVLAASDVRAASWPDRLAPDGAAGGAAADAVGRSLAIAVPAGLPLVEGVLATEEWWTEAPPGAVAAPVRLPDPELAGLLRAGDRVDLYATPVEGGDAELLARRAFVLAGAGRATPEAGGIFGGGGSAASSLVLVAITQSEARALASHAVSAVVSAVLVQ